MTFINKFVYMSRGRFIKSVVYSWLRCKISSFAEYTIMLNTDVGSKLTVYLFTGWHQNGWMGLPVKERGSECVFCYLQY